MSLFPKRGAIRRRYEDDGISDEEIEGKRTFDLEEKLTTNKYNANFVVFMEGKGECPLPSTIKNVLELHVLVRFLPQYNNKKCSISCPALYIKYIWILTHLTFLKECFGAANIIAVRSDLDIDEYISIFADGCKNLQYNGYSNLYIHSKSLWST